MYILRAAAGCVGGAKKDKVERNGTGTVREMLESSADWNLPCGTASRVPSILHVSTLVFKVGMKGCRQHPYPAPAYSRYSKERSLLLPFSFGAQEHPCARVKAKD